MKKQLIIGVVLALFSSPSFANQTVSTVNPAIPANNSSLSSSVLRSNFQATYNDINTLFGYAALPITNSTTGQVIFNNAGVVGGVTMNGDCTWATLTGGVITCTKTNGVPFGALATENTLPPSQLPAFTGDISTSAGSSVTTLATVNSNVGAFGSSTAIPTITVNGKGLVTAASTNVVVAPAGTLTGTSLASNVVSSVLTSVGTIATGIWNGTPINLSSYASGTLQAAQEPAHTGDVTNTAGSLALTLATVNSNTGAIGSSTAIPVITLNGKGLATAATTTPVIAPAGTLTGTALASNVVTSSLTSFGTLSAPLNIGTAGFSDTGVAMQITGSVNGYLQQILQNTNTGSSASADYIVGGNDMTASSHYLDLGKNGLAGATTPFSNADAAYLYTSDNELDIAALGTSGVINFATGASPTTQMSIGTSGVTLTTALAPASGGTGATSLGATLTNSGGVLNTTNPADYAVTGGSTTNIASCSSFSGRTINVSGGSGATTLTLPSASTAGCTQGVTFELDNNTSSLVTWSASGSTCGLVSNLTSSCTVPANTGCVYRSDGTNWPANNALATCFQITVGSLPAATTVKTIRVSMLLPSTGVQGAPYIFPCPGTITGWSITSNAASSSMVLDVWKAASGAVPTISNTITASALPTLSSAQVVRSTTLTGWTTLIAAGDVLLTNVNSFSTGTNFIFTLNYTVSSGSCNAD